METKLEIKSIKEGYVDVAIEYDKLLNRGVRISGEDKQFFIRGRIQDLKCQLPKDFSPRRILDFGCGIGDTAAFLAGIFPEAKIVGIDLSEKFLNYAKQRYQSSRVAFYFFKELVEIDSFDLCYVNGVFHHIPPQKRLDVVKIIHNALSPEGYLALFENNPWNFGTRLIMKLIPFDRNTQPLTPVETRRLIEKAGFVCCAPTRFLFYFPHLLAFLRGIECHLARFPFGAQYYVLAIKQ
jgi:SAM-dependent methyltransferase